MNTTFLGVSIDCTDAATLAGFWASVLGRVVGDGASTVVAVVPASETPGAGPLMMFHHVPEAKTVKNRVHIDLIATDYVAESERLLLLGATRLNEIVNGENRWTTFADPEGNEFDLVAG